MVHLQFQTRYDNEAFEACLREKWEAGAVYFYARWYNFDEKTSEQRALLGAWQAKLRETCPEKFKTGVHKVGSRAAFMGEDVLMVDGDLTHTLHAVCATCGGYSVVSRKGQDKLWCVDCAAHVEAKDW